MDTVKLGNKVIEIKDPNTIPPINTDAKPRYKIAVSSVLNINGSMALTVESVVKTMGRKRIDTEFAIA